MKNTFALTILCVILAASVVVCCGCAQLGETETEGNRRHLRNFRISQQQLMEDVDNVMMFDEPSKLTDRRMP